MNRVSMFSKYFKAAATFMAVVVHRYSQVFLAWILKIQRLPITSTSFECIPNAFAYRMGV